MNASLMMILGAGLLQVPPLPTEQPSTLAVASSSRVPAAAASYGRMSYGHEGCGCASACHGSCDDDGLFGDGCLSGKRHHLESTCDMPQHIPYEPMFHGYYYFRPYNDAHVLEHKALAPQLGGDPRAPYATTMFQEIYEATVPADGYEAEPADGKLLPAVSPPLPDLQDLLENSES